MSVALSSLKHHVRHLTVETWTNHNFLFLIYFNLSVNKPISNTFGFFCKKNLSISIILYIYQHSELSCWDKWKGRCGLYVTIICCQLVFVMTYMHWEMDGHGFNL
jgi:hypothetical protein